MMISVTKVGQKWFDNKDVQLESKQLKTKVIYLLKAPSSGQTKHLSNWNQQQVGTSTLSQTFYSNEKRHQKRSRKNSHDLPTLAHLLKWAKSLLKDPLHPGN
ncbi:hypothetical protein CHARACLAT_009273 [Characodon lateralis]|uniref:Uncharacterized protein n=1 Tax=Characodon lateralis TaxID=208331 RepID=A0ABU7CQZ5_9TELE|nr:hypothetical protein [Characodon lateralis]